MLSGLMDLLLLDSSSNEYVLAAYLVLLMLHELSGEAHCESRVNDVSHGSAWVRAPGELIPLGSIGSRVGRCYSITVFFLDALFLLAFFSTRRQSVPPRHPLRLPAPRARRYRQPASGRIA